MSAYAAALPDRAGPQKKHVPTCREIERHLRATFPTLSASKAKRTARAALDVRGVRPEVDTLRWAVAEVERREHPARRLSLRGKDPVPADALHNIAAGVTLR